MENRPSKRFRRAEIIFLVIVSTVLILSISALVTTISISNAPPTPTATITITTTATATFTASPYPTRTITPTYTSTLTNTPTRTNTITPTPSETPFPSNTPTAFIFDQGEFERAFVIDQVIPGIINRMLIANDGSFWFASPYAVGRYDRDTNKFSQVNLRDPVIGLTKDGRAWILSSSRSPLQSWDGSSFTNYDQTNSWLITQGYGAPSPLGSALSFDHQDNLWITTAYDVRRLINSQWQIFNPQQLGFELPNRKAIGTSYILTHSKIDEKSWAGSCNWSEGKRLDGDGVRQFDGRLWDEIRPPASNGCVTALSADDDGYLWVGMDEQLWRYDPERDTWQAFDPPPLDPTKYRDFRHGVVLEITLTPDGSSWILYELCGAASCQTRQIRYRILNGRWTAIQESSQIAAALLLFDGNGTAWSLMPNEISRLENGVFKPVAWMDWLQAAIDPEGNVWVLTGKLNAEMSLWNYEP